MSGAEGIAAAVFYLALGATIGGAILLARGAVEGRTGGRGLAIALLALGLAGIIASLAVYVTGPRRMLPF